MALIYDDLFQEHVAPMPHPERPERLEAIKRALTDAGVVDRAETIPLRDATFQELSLIHGADYLGQVERILSRGISGYLDMGDTFYSGGTREAAQKAAGGAIDVALAVYRGDVPGGMVVVRPPGHHAERDMAMGFCIYNNVALAAAALLREGAKKVAIVDFDVHHGNGTQHSFEVDPRVMYCSIHQSPLFPGTGDVEEIGRGDGLGSTINMPLAPYCQDADWYYALGKVIIPALTLFGPEMLLVSAGFDASSLDSISAQEVSDSGFAMMEALLTTFADEHCGGKIAVYLEGGYHLGAVATGMLSFARILENRPRAVVDADSLIVHKTTEQTAEFSLKLLSRAWPSLVPS
ncbi:histone deacetylase [Myxococcota bacterium]|nr:histone deacetylase [Myxococcota bacterium]